MKQVKRKRKTASDATSVAEPAAAAATEAKTADPSPIALALPTACTIREGSAVKGELLKLLNNEQTVVLDISAVERVDTAGLQLLCAFVRDRRAHGKRTQWSGSPAAFSEAVELLGLTQVLGYAAEASV
jgi:anti-anti-sigma regulatory factor